MLWSYEYVSKKFYPEIKDVWTMKGIVEGTAELADTVYLTDALTGRHYSYAESNAISNRIANALMSLGLSKGDRIGIYMANRPDYIFALFGVGKAGLVEVPINANLREQEITHMVNNAEITTIIVDSNEDFIQKLTKVSADSQVLKNVIIRGDLSDVPEMRAKILSLSEIMDAADDSNPKIDVGESDNYCIFFTSGTTGLPKGAPITNKTFVLASQSVCAIPEITPEIRHYTCLPLFHANAQLYSMTAMRCLGASLVLSDRFSPKKFWREITENKADYFNSIGGMMQILDAAFEPKDVPEHTAKFVAVGGTPAALWERFEKKFKVDVFEIYSLSEAPVLFGNIEPKKSKRKIGSFGKQIFHDLGRTVRIADDDNKELKVGTGELVQKGEDFIIKGYWDAPEADKEAFDSEGWFHTGDLIRVDEDGYHYYVDRKKFMFRVAGENVSAFEVEAAINSHPSVAQSAAIPVPDPIRDEEIKMLIKLNEGVEQVDMEDIIRHATKRLAYFKVPRYIEIIDEFPMTSTERIQKVQLKNKEKEKKDHGWDRNKEIPDWRERYYGK